MSQAGFSALDDRGRGLAPAGARPRRLWSGAQWTEGPVYLPVERCVLFSDIPNDRVLRYDEASGETAPWLDPSGYHNGHTLDREGRLISCEHGARRVTRRENDGSVTVLADRFAGGRLNSPNDVVVSSDGAIWFTDPPYGIVSDREGHAAPSEQAANHVFRIDPGDGSLSVVSSDLQDPNGLAFSPDESLLYVSDTSAARHGDAGNHHIVAFDVVDDATGLASPRVFTVMEPGLSDGIRVDGAGNVWSSCADGVRIFAPDAAPIAHLPIPEVVSNLTFGGPEATTLYITASASLYAVELTRPPR